MSFTNIIEIEETGGPEVLKRKPLVAMSPPDQGEVVVEQSAIGVNFIDTYHRSGLYPVKLPFVAGVEGAGTVIEVGEGVERLKVGDRVAYVTRGGTYGAHFTGPADVMVKLPESVSTETAAAIMLKGLTAWMLAFEIRPARPGDVALVWAPSGGVGQLLVPWLASLGVHVIAVTSSDEKAEKARRAGALDVVFRDSDVADAVRTLTGGQGVDVAYDSVGRSSQDASLSSLKRCGWWITYGNASGPAEPVPPGRLALGGSLVMTRPTLFDFIARRADLERGAAAVFGALRAGTLEAEIGQRFSLGQAEEAHRALESGTTVGATILTP